MIEVRYIVFKREKKKERENGFIAQPVISDKRNLEVYKRTNLAHATYLLIIDYLSKTKYLLVLITTSLIFPLILCKFIYFV